ncbi:hypothetical protein B566_EDAN002159 [Ephemera danica]|nr:hypothetical protein B566_EDAN002159 [Ephemera danica]
MVNGKSVSVSCVWRKAASAVLAFYLYCTWHFKRWENMGIPFIPPTPFFGNVKDRILLRRSFTEVHEEIYRYFDSEPVGGMFEGRRPILILRDPDIIKNIMVRDFECFVDRMVMSMNPKSINESMLIFMKGNEWKNVRQVSTPIFTSGKMKAMSQLVTDCTQQMISYLDKYHKGKDIEMKNFFGRFTLDVIASCAFGIQCDSLANPDAELVQVISRFNDIGLLNQLAIFLSVVVLDSVKLAKLFNVSFMNKDTTTYLSNLVLSSKAQRETSSTLLTFASYELALNPEVQERARTEVREVLARHDVERTCTAENYQVEGTKARLCKGDIVVIPIRGLHHDPRYYPKPEIFDPDRFLPENKQKSCYLYCTWTFKHWEYMGIPFIPPTPFFGNVADRLMFRKSFSDVQQELYTKFDGHAVAGIYEGRIPMLLIRDPELIKIVMVRDFECFIDRFTTTIRPKSVNESMLLCLKGTEWKDIRHISTPIFSSGKLKAMTHLITNCTEQMINYLDKFHYDEDIEMKEFFGRFTLDVIASCAFGVQCDSLANPEAEFVKVMSRFNDLSLFNIAALILSVVIFSSSTLAKLLGVRFMNQDTVNYLTKFVLDAKSRREQEVSDVDQRNKTASRVDFLKLMLDAQAGRLKSTNESQEDADIFENDAKLNDFTSRKSASSALTDNVVIGQSLLFLLAGFETSSTLLTFASYELALNPDVQERARTEVREVLARHDGRCSYEAISQMSYLENVLNETLRKHPPVSRVERVCTAESYHLEGTKARLCKGDVVAIPIRGLHYDPRYYPQPEKFDPDRFLPENKQSRSPYVFLPFGSGPRNCIGMRFAMLSSKMAMASLLSVYSFHPSSRTDIPVRISKKGVFLKAAKGVNNMIILTTLTLALITSPWITVLLVITSVAVYLYLTWNFKHFKTMGVPYLKPILFFGNLKDRLLFQKSISEVNQELYQQLKGHPIGGIFQGRLPTLMILDPNLIRNVMVRDFDCFMDRRTFSIRPESPMENTLLNLKGSMWKDVRHVSTPIFSSGKMRMMTRLVTDCTLQMINYLERHHGDREIEMKELFGRFTLDVIASCAFGIQCDSLSNPEAEFVKVISQFNKQTFVKRITIFLSLFIFDSKWLAKFLGVTFINLETEKYLSNVVLNTKNQRETEATKTSEEGERVSSRRVDFLQLMLDAQAGCLKSGSSDHNEDIDLFIREAQLKDIATKASISDLEYFANLALNPEVQQRLRTEVREVLARHNDKCSYEAIAEMNYLENVLNETLRKHPPAARVQRVCTAENYQVDGINGRLRKGDIIEIPIRGLHYDPKYYPEPEKFDPDRFLPENKQKRSPYVYLPFGSGPRNCIGMRFAMMSSKIAMASLLNVYNLEPCDRTEVPYKISISSMNIMIHFATLTLALITSPWIIVTLFTSVLLYLYLSWNFKHFKKMAVPYIQPAIFFGNFKDRMLFRKSLSEVNQELYQEFDGHPVCGVFEGRRPFLMIRDPNLIRNVMVRDFDCFMDRRVAFSIRPESPMENMLINLKGSRWKDVRHVSTPIFSSGKIKSMSRLVTECTQQMISFLEKHHGDKEIEMKGFFGRFTLDVIASCAFGIKCDSLSNPDAEFVKVISRFNKHTVMKRIAIFLSHFIFESRWLAKLLGASFINLDTEEYLSNVVINTKKQRETEASKARKDGEMISSRRVDFLQLMMDAQTGNLKSDTAHLKEDTDLFARDAQWKDITTKAPISAVTDIVVIGQSMVFLIAGFETSSTLLTFTCYELALNPEIQIRARSEVQEVLARHNGKCSYEAIAEMKYLENVLNETLRKHPPTSRIERVCTVKHYQVDGTQARLRKGEKIEIPIRGLHYDPKYYPEPEKFDPDRFLPENKQKRSPYVFLPFGSGPRNCIGMRFAMMSSKMAMASLLNVYNLEACDRTEVPYKINVHPILLHPANGIYLKLKKLKKSI